MQDCSGCEDCAFVAPSSVERHEIHVTVETYDVGLFVAACRKHGIKPIVVDLGGGLQHVMTSQPVKGDRDAASTETSRILFRLEQEGFSVERIKIETNRPPLPEDTGYFESHLAYCIPEEKREELRAVLLTCGEDFRLSQNAFKRDGDFITIMATLRCLAERDWAEFKGRVDDVVQHAFCEGLFLPDKIIIEYCWYDSALYLDDNWKFENKG